MNDQSADTHVPISVLKGLSERLAQNERSSRRWKWVATGLVVCVVTLLGTVQFHSSKNAKVVEAEKFIIRDSAGTIRGELSTARDDSPKLWLYDKGGTRRAELSLLPDGTPGLRLLDEHEVIRATVSIFEHRPSLTLRDNEDRERVKLVVLPDGEPYLQLRDKTGNVVWTTPSHGLEVKN